MPAEFPVIYRSELIPRRGEWIAWSFALLAIFYWAGMRLTEQATFGLFPVLVIALFVSALLISLNNWVDRRTLIKITEEAITFENGLRRVRLSWNEIKEVRIFPSRWGKKVQVFSDKAYFSFRTLGEVTMNGEVKGRMGFERGEEIIRQIILN